MLQKIQTIALFEMFNNNSLGAYADYSLILDGLINPSYYLFYKIATYAICVAIMCAGIYLLISGKDTRDDAKQWTIRIVLVAILIFCLLDVFALIKTAGTI